MGEKPFIVAKVCHLYNFFHDTITSLYIYIRFFLFFNINLYFLTVFFDEISITKLIECLSNSIHKFKLNV